VSCAGVGGKILAFSFFPSRAEGKGEPYLSMKVRSLTLALLRKIT